MDVRYIPSIPHRLCQRIRRNIRVWHCEPVPVINRFEKNGVQMLRERAHLPIMSVGPFLNFVVTVAGHIRNPGRHRLNPPHKQISYLTKSSCLVRN